MTAKEVKTIWAIGDQHGVRDLAIVGRNLVLPGQGYKVIREHAIWVHGWGTGLP